jgi:hypothetical protein
MDGILNTDTYYTMEGIMTSLGRGGRPWTCRCCRQRIHLLPAGRKHISVGKQYAGHKIALAFTGITTLRAWYNKKQANALAAVTRVLAVRGANRGDKGLLLW